MEYVVFVEPRLLCLLKYYILKSLDCERRRENEFSGRLGKLLDRPFYRDLIRKGQKGEEINVKNRHSTYLYCDKELTPTFRYPTVHTCSYIIHSL